MPRARRPPAETPYQRRNRRARELGYKSYYDYRIHDNGKLSPTEAPPTGETRQRLRGHRGTQDLLAFLREGDLIVLATPIGMIKTDDRGRFVEADKIVFPESPKRKERTFRVRGLTRRQMAALIEQERKRGAIWTPAPSRDQRRLIDTSGSSDA